MSKVLPPFLKTAPWNSIVLGALEVLDIQRRLSGVGVGVFYGDLGKYSAFFAEMS